MSAAITQSARYSILTVDLPGEVVNAGVLLEDTSTNRLHLRMRRDWDLIVPGEAEVFAELGADLTAKSMEMGADRLLQHLEDTLSNALRVTDRRDVVVEDFTRTLGRLYRENVQSNVLPFVTHLPRHSLAVAAGMFLENSEVEAEGWEEAPADLKLTPEMIVARISGRSMEPRIPDGCLCVFRKVVEGSRQGRLVLVEELGGGAHDRYTIKRYRSEKIQRPDGSWSHARVSLEPLNPEFESWDLDPEEDRFRILAEFVRVLD